MFFKDCDESVAVRWLNQMSHFMNDDVLSALAGHPIKFPQMDLGTMMPLLFGMLGLGAEHDMFSGAFRRPTSGSLYRLSEAWAFSSPRKMYGRSTHSAKRVPFDLGRVRLSAVPSI